MSYRLRIGMLTPSSNTVLEPVTSALLAGIAEASAHFARFRVTEIALSAGALAQFADEPMLQAATLLADARPDVICWNGTSAGWRGFDNDERLCVEIARRTGVQACTSILALNEIMTARGVQRFGLVSPYTQDVQQRIIDNYAAIGHQCVAHRYAGLSENYAFAEVDDDTLRRMVREVAHARPQAIAIYCTNLRAAPLVHELEAETGIPILDTIAVVIWKALKLCGVPPGHVKGWGRLFQESV